MVCDRRYFLLFGVFLVGIYRLHDQVSTMNGWEIFDTIRTAIIGLLLGDYLFRVVHSLLSK